MKPVVSASKLESFSRIAGWTVALLGVSVLAGWLLGIEALKRVAPGLTSMKPNTALAFVLSGIATWLLTSSAPPARRMTIGKTLAAAVILIGAVTLVEIVFAVDLGVDQILIKDSQPDPTNLPGRMSGASALNFVLMGWAFFSLGRKNPAGIWRSQYGVTAAAGVTFVVLLGYLFSFPSEGYFLSYTAMAVHAAAGFFLLSLAVLATRHSEGFAAILLEGSSIGLMSRRMMLAAVLLPGALGWLAIGATFQGLSLGFVVAMGVGLATLFFAALIVRSATVAARSETARAAIERRFEDLIEGAPNAIAVTDGQARLVYFNRQAEELFGYARDEVLGRDMEMLVPERFRQAHVLLTGNYMAAPQVRSKVRQLFALRKDGAEIPVDINLAPIGGRESGLVMIVMRDISEAIAIQRTLETAERNYRTIFENAVEGIFRSSPGGRLLMANPALAEMFGYGSPEDLLGSVENVAMLYASSTDRERFKTVVEAEGIIRNHEFQFVHKNGSWRWAAISARAVRDSSGNVLHYEGFIQDIGARKRAEEMHNRLMQILDNTPDVVSMVDWNTRLGLYLNKAGRLMFGVDNFEDAARMGFRLPRPDWTQDAFDEALDAAVRDGHHVGESVLLAVDGSEIPVSQTVIALKTPSGEIDFVSVIARDITKLRALETQFHQSQRVEAIGQFAGGIAHDFNNLLTVILGYSQIVLEAENLDPVLARNVQGIRDAGIKAAGLTRQLLAFGRRQVLRPTVMNLNAVVRDLERILPRLIPESIRFVTRLEKDLGMVRADSGQIEQVIINLAINARDAMPDGGVLTIETANTELSSTHSRFRFGVQPGRYVMISVADTGSGMDEETQAHIFEPFFTTKPVGKGTGLGLSVVYGIVKQSNGYIWLYSEPGRGSAFKIYLPRVDEGIEEGQAAAKGDEKVRAATETVLVVEDDLAVRELAGLVLTSAGYTVLPAEHVHDALRHCREHAGAIDVLLTDVVMPEMNGFELVKRVRTLRPGIEVVVMTGYAPGAFKSEEVLDPNIAFIEKPFSADLLLGAIRGRLDKRTAGAAGAGREDQSPMVLVVDDDAAVREFVRLVLKNAGYRVAAAGDGVAALRVLRNTRCDLVIADVVMPFKDGLELGVEIAREFPDVKLVLMSAAAPGPYLEAVPHLKTAAVLEKPLTSETLRETVSAVLRGSG